jgi:hypothetical protein
VPVLQHRLLGILNGYNTVEMVGLSPMKENQMDQEHEDQDSAEGANDGGASRGIQADREVDAQGRDQGSHGPSNCEPWTYLIREQHRSDRWNDQVAEHQQDAGCA